MQRVTQFIHRHYGDGGWKYDGRTEEAFSWVVLPLLYTAGFALYFDLAGIHFAR